MKDYSLHNCHDCNAAPGQQHMDGCDTEHCSVCGGQRMCCDCVGHDKDFAKWTGIWPGFAEATLLGLDLNEFARKGYHDIFFVKKGKDAPQAVSGAPGNSAQQTNGADGPSAHA